MGTDPSEGASAIKKSSPTSSSSEESKDIDSSELSDDDKPVSCLRCPSCRAMLPRDFTKAKKTVTIEIEKKSEKSQDTGSHASIASVENKVSEHSDNSQLRETLQKILGELMATDASAIDTLRNHAKTLGGVLGAEYAYFEQQKIKKQKLEEEFFHDSQ